jgi:hypothetical protein
VRVQPKLNSLVPTRYPVPPRSRDPAVSSDMNLTNRVEHPTWKIMIEITRRAIALR